MGADMVLPQKRITSPRPSSDVMILVSCSRMVLRLVLTQLSDNDFVPMAMFMYTNNYYSLYHIS